MYGVANLFFFLPLLLPPLVSLFLTPSFSLLLSPGSSRDGERYRFSIKFLLKSNDFDCPGWPGAAGMEKVSIFIEIPF